MYTDSIATDIIYFKGHFRGQDTGKSYCHVYIHEAYILLQILQPLASL